VHWHLTVERQAACLMTQRINVGAGVLHHGENAGGSRPRAMNIGLIGIPVTAIKGIEIARPMGGVDRHPSETGLFQIINAGSSQLLGQRRSHGGSLQCGGGYLEAWLVSMLGSALLPE